MEINKTFAIYKTKNMHAYYLFFENIIKTTIFKKKYKKDDTDNIIYEKEFIITYDNPILAKFCTLFCVGDPNDKNRFFVGINMCMSIFSYGLTGLFIYFNNENISDMIIVSEILKEYDSRNNIITAKETFLYNQSLVFLEKHRDLNNFRITICCFDYYDKLSAKHTDITDISGKYRLYNKWLIFNDTDIIDLSSVHVESNRLKYNMYKIISDMEAFLKIASVFNEIEYCDYYPKNCIKCNELTCITTFYNKINECASQIINMGNSYCHNCAIRYSLSNKSWVCCKLIEDDKFCFKKVDTNYNCTLSHNNRKLAYIMKNYSGKKPYKNDLELFIVRIC